MFVTAGGVSAGGVSAGCVSISFKLAASVWLYSFPPLPPELLRHHLARPHRNGRLVVRGPSCPATPPPPHSSPARQPGQCELPCSPPTCSPPNSILTPSSSKVPAPRRGTSLLRATTSGEPTLSPVSLSFALAFSTKPHPRPRLPPLQRCHPAQPVAHVHAHGLAVEHVLLAREPPVPPLIPQDAPLQHGHQGDECCEYLEQRVAPLVVHHAQHRILQHAHARPQGRRVPFALLWWCFPIGHAASIRHTRRGRIYLPLFPQAFETAALPAHPRCGYISKPP